MEADYADDILLFENTPTLAEPLLHSMEQSAEGIGLHMNVNKKCTCILIEEPSPL